MPRLHPLAILLLAVSAAAADGKAIIGSWAVDTDAMWEMAKAKVPPEQQELARGIMTQMLGQMRWVVSADKVVTTAPGGRSEESTYVVESATGDDVVIASTRDGTTERLTMTVKGDRATLRNETDAGKTVPLKRVAADAAAPATAATPAP